MASPKLPSSHKVTENGTRARYQPSSKQLGDDIHLQLDK